MFGFDHIIVVHYCFLEKGKSNPYKLYYAAMVRWLVSYETEKKLIKNYRLFYYFRAI